ncbi:MAG: glycosyltransferase family 39 protein [bacterium]
MTEENKYAHKLVFVIIIGLFLLLKLININTAFDGPHAQKYATYVEPALNMAEYDNPLKNFHQYRYNPFSENNSLQNRNFSHLPLFEWPLYILFEVFGVSNIEAITHAYTSILGVILLLLMHAFFKVYFSQEFCLSFITIVATSMIFNLATKITVLDTISYIFMFLSLLSFNKFIFNNKVTGIFNSGLFFGLGMATKISLFLWYAPIVLSICILLLDKKIYEKISVFFLVHLIALTVFILCRYSIFVLPTKLVSGMSILAVSILIYLLTYSLSLNLFNKISKLVSNFFSSFFKGILTVVIVSLLSVYIFIVLNLSHYSVNFLTDETLIFNFKMYFEILYDLMSYLTPLLTLTAIVGLIMYMVLPTKNRNQNTILLAFLFGSVIYLVMASKVIYFHIYYNLIFLFSAALLSSYLFDRIFLNIDSRKKSFSILILLLIGFGLVLQVNTLSFLAKGESKENFHRIVDYLEKEMNEDEVWIGDARLSPLVMFSDRPRIARSFDLDHEDFYELKNKIGLKETLKNYGIRFLVTKSNFKTGWGDFKTILQSDKPVIDEKFRNEYIERDLEGNNISKNLTTFIVPLRKKIGNIYIYDLYQLEQIN